VQLKVRFGDFHTVTRSRTLTEATDLAVDLHRVARELLFALDVTPGVRLLGISGQQLVRRTADPGEQGTLFPDAPTDGTPDAVESPRDGDLPAALERSVDQVRARFGPGAVGRGAAHSLPGEGPRPPTR
jgi:DNA polymerase-4